MRNRKLALGLLAAAVAIPATLVFAKRVVREFDAEPRAWAPRFEGRTVTSFERKGQRAGREIRDLVYRRVDRSGE